jgi:photosystem II stability/assembly factor-like uncharacterized protein
MHTYSGWGFFRRVCLYALAGALIASAPARADSKFKDPLDSPAKMYAALTTRPLLDITHAGAALVAVGSRGMIIRSEDEGKNWTQSAVPVQSDLLAVNFPTPQDGWAVGHEGVILHSSDGGKSWEPWLHRIDNDQWLNLNNIRGVGGSIYIAAERGMVFMLDHENQRFRGTPTGYAGSLFGIIGDRGNLLVFGLRGVVYGSDNSGATWETLKMPAKAAVTAGTLLPDSRGFVLVNNGGQMLLSDAQGRSFRVVTPGKPMRFTGVVLTNEGAAVVTGIDGVRSETLSGTTK